MTASIEGVILDRSERARAFWGVMTTFLIHGLCFSAWVSRIPAVKALLGLSDGVLGLSLLGSAVGSVIAIPISGTLVAHFGARRVTMWTSYGFSIAVALPAFARGPFTLFAALVVFGAMAGANDVAMNAEAVATERLLGVRAISRFHGMFSVAAMAGAAAGGLIASLGIAPVRHLPIAALVFIGITIVASRLMPEAPIAESTSRSKTLFRKLPAALVALSVIGFCMLLSEGAVADWAGVFLKQVIHTSDGFAPLGYAVFCAAMAIFRMLGDWISTRIGGAATVRVGASVAAAGLLLVVLAGQPWQVMAGLTAAGAGFSSIVPLVFAAGGRFKALAPGIGVATVSGIGYLGFLVGPPMIGFVSQASSLRWGLFLLVVLSGIAAVLVGFVNRRDAGLWQ